MPMMQISLMGRAVLGLHRGNGKEHGNYRGYIRVNMGEILGLYSIRR